MKKILTAFLLFIFSFQFSVFAYSSQTQKFITAFEQQMVGMTKDKKEQYLNLISSILNNSKVKKNKKSEVKILVSELNNWLDDYKKSLRTNTVILDGTNYQTLQNIDFDKVRNTWIKWHNDFRAEKGVSPYSYHSELERSAKIWADNLVSKGIVSGFHAREDSDGYYNYNSIKQWFGDLGIKFPKEKSGIPVFTESVGYRSYKCNLKDCTQTLLDATKKIFDGFVNEGENGAHYKAIVSPNFTQLGIGFQVNESTKIIYVVIHYAGDIVE